MTKPRLTIFTSPKPFIDPHIRLIQTNALRCWRNLGEVEVMVIGDEEGCAEISQQVGAIHIPRVTRNEWGTPLVSDLFTQAQQQASSPLMMFANADMLFTPQLLIAAEWLHAQYPQFLLIGQRWDLDLNQELDFSQGWDEQLMQLAKQKGKLHLPAGSDYFIFPKGCFTSMPSFAIGRSGWDNWMIYEAWRNKMYLVDGSLSVFAVHQNHDYHHLPNGKPHYDLEESQQNIRLAGGPTHLFTVLDAEWQLVDGKLVRPRFSWLRLLRRMERALQPQESDNPSSVLLKKWIAVRKWLARRFRRLRRRLVGSL